MDQQYGYVWMGISITPEHRAASIMEVPYPIHDSSWWQAWWVALRILLLMIRFARAIYCSPVSLFLGKWKFERPSARFKLCVGLSRSMCHQHSCSRINIPFVIVFVFLVSSWLFVFGVQLSPFPYPPLFVFAFWHWYNYSCNLGNGHLGQLSVARECPGLQKNYLLVDIQIIVECIKYWGLLLCVGKLCHEDLLCEQFRFGLFTEKLRNDSGSFPTWLVREVSDVKFCM